ARRPHSPREGGIPRQPGRLVPYPRCARSRRPSLLRGARGRRPRGREQTRHSRAVSSLEEGSVNHEDSASAVYEREWQSAVAANESGRLEEARRHLSAALAAAQVLRDEELEERVLCGQAAVAGALGEA